MSFQYFSPIVIWWNGIGNESSLKRHFFQRVHLDIQVGEHAVDYAHVAQKEKLSELQLRVRQLLDQVEQITKEQNYQRVRFGNNKKDSFKISIG
jgi:emp24/gp25L/p24 family/GOLD